MRAGLSTIQQTLTPEAANVLNHSIAEAGRRNHGQTTPLHVAATLLASPTGFLRQACIRSHPNSSHPLQCRALELCFSVALERLPTSTSSPAVTEPPISNALMAALKRAQAHQRRGCPEQQQQPLLAVKVELEQLIISILDDPSVSRVMREASFSSPAVKATIEQSLNNNNPSSSNHLNPSALGVGFRPSLSPTTSTVSIPINRNLYLNPRLQQQEQGNQRRNDESTVSPSAPRNLYLNPRIQPQGSLSLNQSGQQRNDDVRKVIDIMLKWKKRNPILVGELEPEAVRKEILKRIEKGELVAGGELKNVEVISIEKEFISLSDKSQIPGKIRELGDLIESRIGISENSGSTGKGIIVDLADLKWLVEHPPTADVSDVGRESVAEMGKLVAKFGAESSGATGRIWLIGTATCETYLRCQVYHPSMETSWDLQAVPIASGSPIPNMFPRMGTNGILGNSVESLNSLKNFQTTASTMPRCLSENLDPAWRLSFCPKCSGEYEQELAKLNKEFEKSLDEVKSTLPQWLQTAKAQSCDDKTTDQSKVKEQELELKQRTQELHKKWNDTCLQLHPNHHQNPRLDRMTPNVVPIPGMYKPNMLLQPSPTTQPPRLQPPRTLEEALQLKPNQETRQQPQLEPPRSPVPTDLALGPKKLTETSPPKANEDLTVKDLLGCISSEPQAKVQEFQKGNFANAVDADSFKKLLKGLMRKAWWQPEAASTIATTVTQSKVGSGSRGCVWLLLAGPDRVGKKKMASVIAEHVCGANPITICLGLRRDEEELDMGFRGKTALDRIVEAVRRNPFSVIMLSDIDEADLLVRGSIKRAMERGRITDSHGREISLGNVIFILTGNWSTANLNEHLLDERRLHSIASGDWQLRLTIGEKRLKRKANWLLDKDRSMKPRKEQGSGLSLDLNLAVDVEEDRTDGSLNSSDLTMEQEDLLALENRHFAVTSVPSELVGPSDGAVVFKPVHFGLIRREIEKTIRNAFSSIVDDKVSIEVDEAALENVLGGLWFGRTDLEEWAEQVLIPSFHQLKAHLPSSGEDLVVRLESDRDTVQASDGGDWLPSKITVMADGV